MMQIETPQYHAAASVIERLRAAGHEAYFVGGAVRNMLMNLPPKDFDVATSARPEEVSALFPQTLMIGQAFGVAVVTQDGERIEVATFRRDGRYLDYRHPDRVHFSSAREDARRRDFTINALFFDPMQETVIDYVGGQEDLKAKVLRTVGDPDERFQEDALRLLRAVRFARRFDLKMDPFTKDAIQRHARLLKKISAERIRDELVLMLTGPRPGDALQQLFDLGLLAAVLPEVAQMHGVEQPPQFHPEGDVFRHTVLCLNAMRESPSTTLALGVLLHDVGKPPTRTRSDRIRFNEHAPVGATLTSRICRRLKFSNSDRDQIVGLVRDHMRFIDVQKMKQSTLRRFLGKTRFEEDLELHRADCLGSGRSLENYDFCLKILAKFREDGQAPAPTPWITGDDLIALGVKPGPHFKAILQQVYDLQLEGRVTSRHGALEELKQIVKKSL